MRLIYLSLLLMTLVGCVTPPVKINPFFVTERYTLYISPFNATLTVEHSDSETTITSEYYSQPSKRFNGLVLIQKRNVKLLSEKQWIDIRNALEKGFWNHNTENYGIGSDGDTFVLEGRRGNTFKRIERWFPYDKPNEKSFLDAANTIGSFAP